MQYLKKQPDAKKSLEKGTEIIYLGWIMAGGTAVLPHNYFGIPERFSVFAGSGFTTVLGAYNLESK